MYHNKFKEEEIWSKICYTPPVSVDWCLAPCYGAPTTGALQLLFFLCSGVLELCFSDGTPRSSLLSLITTGTLLPIVNIAFSILQGSHLILFATGANTTNQAWWHMSVVPEHRPLKQKEHEFEATLGHRSKSISKNETPNWTKPNNTQI